MELSRKQLEQLLSALETANVSEFEYKDNKYSVRLVLGRGMASSAAGAATLGIPPATVSEAPAPSGPSTPEPEDTRFAFVTSPFVGTFYRAPSPEAQPFVEVGAKVAKGQALCIVEAMKLMNEIESEFAGTVVEALVDNGVTVEYGQRLFKIEKA